MERVTRTPDEPDKNYHSLKQCIEEDAGLSTKVARRWKEVKGGALFCAILHKHNAQIPASIEGLTNISLLAKTCLISTRAAVLKFSKIDHFNSSFCYIPFKMWSTCRTSYESFGSDKKRRDLMQRKRFNSLL
jgi:hypothetical protein